MLACSRLRDGGGKSFSNKKCEIRAEPGERQVVRVLLGSLSSDVFEQRTSTGNELFAHLSRDCEQIFGQIVSIRIKTLGNTNTVA